MSSLTSESIKHLVSQQLAAITDPTVYEALSALLVEPVLSPRMWIDGDTVYPCWTVAVDGITNTHYVYSGPDFYLPALLWGIVGGSDHFLGMDSNWFETLERAFYDSWASAALPIWRVVKRATDDIERSVTCDLTDKQAHELVSSLNAKHASDNESLFAIEPRTQRWW
jgi:hypothetical protein